MAQLVCCSWRDAVTDPPMSDWTGYVKTSDQIKILARIVNGVVYVFSPHTSRAFTVVPGDQWLDITDMPAVPKEKVQALADLAKNRIRHGEIVQASEIYGLLVQEIEHFTGITPSGVKDSLTTEVPS